MRPMIPLWILKCVYAEKRKLLLPSVVSWALVLFSPGRPLQALCGQRQNEGCQGWDSRGLTAASALGSDLLGRVLRTSLEGKPGNTCLSLVLCQPGLRFSKFPRDLRIYHLGRDFFQPSCFQARRHFFKESLSMLCPENGWKTTSICDPLLS